MIGVDLQFVRMLGGRERKFRQTDQYTFNLRCPYCGDSDKDENKARGYFWRTPKQSLAFYCHNCQTAAPLPKYLKDNHPDLFQEYKVEMLKMKYGEDWEEQKARKERERQEEQRQRDAQPKTLSNDPDMGVDLWSLPEDHMARQYVEGRKLPKRELYYTEDVLSIAKSINYERYKERKFSTGPRLVIPFRDMNGEITGVSCRGLNEDMIRYVHLQVNRDHYSFYGLDQVDFSQTVYVLEGQFDAMLMGNAIAVGGSALKKLRKFLKDTNIDKDTFVLVWDNEPRNADLCKSIRAAILNGFNTVVWNKAPFKGKDINEMVCNGHSVDEIKTFIRSNSANEEGSFKQTRLMAKYNAWKRC